MPQKRTTASGTVYWSGRYRDPSGRERSRSFDTRREAKAWEDQKKLEVAAGTWTSPELGLDTLQALADTWALQATNDGTRRIREQLAKNLGDLGPIPVGRLTTPLIRTWVGQLQHGRHWVRGCRGLADATRSSFFSQLKAMLEQATDDGVIPRNPCGKISVPRPDTAVSWEDIPTVGQVLDLIEVAREGGRRKLTADGTRTWVRRHPHLGVAISVAAATGMRASEVAGLTWMAVDFDAGEISVVAQAAKYGPGLTELKTRDSGRRVISVDEGTMRLLEEHRRAFPGYERVLLNHGGRPMVGTSFAMAMAHARTYLGFPESITPKSLRHFHATELLRAGVPIKVVQHRLGHAKAQLTLDTYGHFMPTDDLRAAAVMGELLADEGTLRGRASRLAVVEGVSPGQTA